MPLNASNTSPAATVKSNQIHFNPRNKLFFSATGKGLWPTSALKIAPENKFTLSFVTNCWLQQLQQGGNAGLAG